MVIVCNNAGDLFDAYRATEFWVESPQGRFCLRDGELSEKLDRLLAEMGQRTWAYITACNPRSELLPTEENADRMGQLEAEVAAAGYRFFRGEGIGTEGDWPPEPSLLVIGIEESSARELGRKYEQNAILIGRRGGRARLTPC